MTKRGREARIGRETTSRTPPRTVIIAPGVAVPYPEPSGDAATRIGRANRRVDTRAEVALRSELHARGLRFRKDHLVRERDVRVHIDVAFTRIRVAVFVDGCFWHSCPLHQHLPKRNVEYWLPKLEANRARDRRVDAALRGAGWVVIRVWEHESAMAAANEIAPIVQRLRERRGATRDPRLAEAPAPQSVVDGPRAAASTR